MTAIGRTPSAGTESEAGSGFVERLPWAAETCRQYRAPRVASVRPGDEVEVHANLALRLDRMPQWAVQLNLVTVPPPLA